MTSQQTGLFRPQWYCGIEDDIDGRRELKGLSSPVFFVFTGFFVKYCK